MNMNKSDDNLPTSMASHGQDSSAPILPTVTKADVFTIPSLVPSIPCPVSENTLIDHSDTFGGGQDNDNSGFSFSRDGSSSGATNYFQNHCIDHSNVNNRKSIIPIKKLYNYTLNHDIEANKSSSYTSKSSFTQAESSTERPLLANYHDKYHHDYVERSSSKESSQNIVSASFSYKSTVGEKAKISHTLSHRSHRDDKYEKSNYKDSFLNEQKHNDEISQADSTCTSKIESNISKPRESSRKNRDDKSRSGSRESYRRSVDDLGISSSNGFKKNDRSKSRTLSRSRSMSREVSRRGRDTESGKSCKIESNVKSNQASNSQDKSSKSYDEENKNSLQQTSSDNKANQKIRSDDNSKIRKHNRRSRSRLREDSRRNRKDRSRSRHRDTSGRRSDDEKSARSQGTSRRSRDSKYDRYRDDSRRRRYVKRSRSNSREIYRSKDDRKNRSRSKEMAIKSKDNTGIMSQDKSIRPRDHDITSNRSLEGFKRHRDDESTNRSQESNAKNNSVSHESSSRQTISRLKRRKPSIYWDVPPVGFEHISPSEYRMMQSSGCIPNNSTYSDTNAVPKPSANTSAKQSRRLYVGNIPFGVTDQEMSDFFNNQFILHGLSLESGDPVVSCQINIDKNFAFLDFRSEDECTKSVVFDGIIFRAQSLKLRRPRDYYPQNGVDIEHVNQFGLAGLSDQVPDSPNKLFLGAIPTYMTAEQIVKILVSFGKLKCFHLVRDTTSNSSRGFGFCEYISTESTDSAIRGLNGFQVGDKRLVVHRSLYDSKGMPNYVQPVALQVPGLSAAAAGNLSTTSAQSAAPPTEVLCLLNMVSVEELEDDDEYEDIVDDIRMECAKYGCVRSIEVPRPSTEKPPAGSAAVQPAGLGKVFVEFESVAECQKAQLALTGRRFASRVVVTSFMSAEKYHCRDF